MPNISEQAVNLLVRYDVKLLKQAGVSGELWIEILEKRNSLMTTFLKNVAGKGNFCKSFLIVLPEVWQLNMFGVFQFTYQYSILNTADKAYTTKWNIQQWMTFRKNKNYLA